jgi:DNA-binding CsgD family transcriptional regulator
MPADLRRARAAGLADRRRERGVLDRLVADVRAGESRTLVVRADPGMGKTALLDYLAERASGCRVVRVAGMQSEMELVFAGLHQLCTPLHGRLKHLPAPQRAALQTAFGLSTGPAPDRFLVGLAVLGLLSEAAAERPLLCLIDDEQWLDQTSAQVLGFVARRLAAEPVGLVFAARAPGDELAGLPELELSGLEDRDARALLDSVLTGPLDARVRDQIVAETGGNPLALLELPRGLTATELAGGFGLPGAHALPGRIEEGFRRRLEALPPHARTLVQLAAADPCGDPTLVWRAAEQLGLPPDAAAPAVDAGLVDFGVRVRFRHPLTRAAAYRSATARRRQEMHAALAAATDAVADPDRRAWHRAQAAAGPDEEVAAELEHCAGRARARGGLAAAAAFLERSVLLSVDRPRRSGRALAAAHANVQAGAFGTALDLLETAESGALDDVQSAMADLLRGQIVFASGMGSDAPPLLLKAAKRLEPLDLRLARETYLDAWHAALFAGRLAGAGDLLEVSRAARALPLPDPPRPIDLLLDGLAQLITDGRAAAVPTLRRAARAFSSAHLSLDEGLRQGWMAQAAATAMWDDEGWRATLHRQARLARGAGALERLPIDLSALAMATAWSGDLPAAESLIVEVEAVSEATGSRIAPYAAMLLAALRGKEAEAAALIDATVQEASAGGQGVAVTHAHWAGAILYNGLGRYDQALTVAEAASRDTPGLYVSMWALPELVEAASRTGKAELADDALARLAETTRPGETDFGLGVEARSRALLAKGRSAEGHYREAIERLGRTRLRPELARAHLLYGEWLRRENRRTDARGKLRTAHRMLSALGAEAFAERARRELLATGETVRKRTVETVDGLTTQEAYIARLAGDGHTNPEIAAQLFISARTVEWHLRKVYTKLGIGSRRELRAALSGPGRATRQR